MNYANLLSQKTALNLAGALKALSLNNFETLRIARVGTCLLFTGSNPNNPITSQCTKVICNTQQSDGGWADNEETMWSLAYLKGVGFLHQENYKKGLQLLNEQRHPNGGWGRAIRGYPRIPNTGLLLHLLPEVSDQDAVNWLINEWKRDFQSNTRLTYKGAFFLLGLSASGVSINECSLIEETYSFLAHEQNDDGGFGPWKDHPIGSDPWSTGIVLLGLLSYPDLIDRNVIERAVNWLGETQLPNGLWPYHYIEEGSAYAYWGLVEALKYLSKEVS